MLTAIIIDDEKNLRENIRLILQNYCTGIEVVDEADSAIAGAGLIAKHRPDVIFLDIEMPGGSGLTLLDNFAETGAKVVLVTAHKNYMQKAFKANVFDYLVKPVDITELQETVERIRNQMSISAAQSSKVGIPSTNGVMYIEKDDLLYIQAQGSYSEVHLHEKESFLVSKNLKHFEKLLLDDQFLRIHRSSLINLRHVREFSRLDGGIVIMSNDQTLPVTKEKRDLLLLKMAEQ
jgi:two-component system LytT family response regulator